jgi:hypothetical protein
MSKEATRAATRRGHLASLLTAPKCALKAATTGTRQCALEAATPTSRDDDHDGEVGSSGMGHISTAAHSNRHMTRPPINHFKRLLEEAYSNHAYPINHKLKDYDMMWSFMTSVSLTWGTEFDEELDESDTTPFLKKNTVMMICEGHPVGEALHVQPTP